MWSWHHSLAAHTAPTGTYLVLFEVGLGQAGRHRARVGLAQQPLERGRELGLEQTNRVSE